MKNLFLIITLMALTPVYGEIVLPSVPTAPIYFEPPVMYGSNKEMQQSCAELDMKINGLHPYRYSYKPKFYEDKNNAAVMTVSVVPIVGGLVSLGYLTYSSLVEEKENRRTLGVEQQISMLQQLKSAQHCYE